MKIGIAVTVEDKTGYGRFGDELYKKVREHGYSCVDYDMADTNSFIYTAAEAEVNNFLKREKMLAFNAGIEISQVHGPWRWPARDFTVEDRNERMEKMKKSIHMTAVLGCKNWVIHPIMPYGVNENNSPDAEKTWEMNIVFMNELLKTAKEENVTICLENMPFRDFSLSKPDKILKFVREINDDNFKICLDTGHVSVFDDLSLEDCVRKLGNEIRVLHVHDNKWGMDLHLMPYFGIIDWKGFMGALRDIDFGGVFSLETAYPKGLDDDLFGEMCIMQAKLARRILEKA